MEWTKDAPTEAGWYFIVDSIGRVSIDYCSELSKKATPITWWLDYLDCTWTGDCLSPAYRSLDPIAMPDPPGEER